MIQHHPMPPSQLRRRTFLASLAASSFASASEAPTLRAAVIGHTGRGDYGHGLEKIFADRQGITLCAIADPDPAGRSRTAAAIGAPRSYASWRGMLAAEKPDLVCVAMRHADQHAEIITACLAAGAHVYAEKPLARDPAECDAITAAAAASGKCCAVAHTTRLAPLIQSLQLALQQGWAGELVTMQAFGKQDQRAGGEDLMVLGSHLMDLMRCFAGDPLWCSARVLTAGRDITRNDARLVRDNVGPVAGDEIFAHFAFPHGINATFTSTARLRSITGFLGLELTGTKRSIRIELDTPALVRFRPTPPAGSNSTQGDQWEAFTPSAAGLPDTPPHAPNAVTDWLAAIREKRAPICSAHHAAQAIEMVCAVYEAALTGSRASFPLANRSHPLGTPR
jgi:predicted dehydrogenase